jgi:Ca2+-binding RTX toxin-like protein
VIRRFVYVSALAAMLPVASPSPSAEAGRITVETRKPCGDDSCRSLLVRGAAAEANRLRVQHTRNGVLFTDTGAAQLRNGDGLCAQWSPRRVFCQTPDHVLSVEIYLGRGHDRATVGFDRTGGNLPEAHINGGPGNDRISSTVQAFIEGQSGDDRLVGARSRKYEDELDGGSGNDVLISRGGRDTLAGGPGSDRLLGGADSVSLFGDSGHDRLRAGRGGAFFYAGSGNDTLIGSAARSAFDDPRSRRATTFPNVVRAFTEAGGGPGNDRLFTVNGRAEDGLISCGSGVDRIRADPQDRVRRCERVVRVR